MIILMENCRKALSKVGESLCKGMQEYVKQHGWHFNEKLLDFAVSNMSTKSGVIKPIGKEDLQAMLRQYNVNIESATATIYDKLFAANMCKADYLGSSIPDKEHLCKYVKDVIDDPDGYEELVFSRWYADICRKGIEVDWEKYI